MAPVSVSRDTRGQSVIKAVHLARGAFPVRRGAYVVSMEIVIKRLGCVTVILAIMELSVAKLAKMDSGGNTAKTFVTVEGPPVILSRGSACVPRGKWDTIVSKSVESPTSVSSAPSCVGARTREYVTVRQGRVAVCRGGAGICVNSDALMERTVKIVAFSAPDVEMAGHVTV